MANDDQGPRIRYRAAGEFAPPGFHGRFALTVGADGAARLEHEQGGIVRRWSARVEAVVWPRLVAALRRGDFPRTPPLGPLGGGVRELRVTGTEPAGELWLPWGDGDAVGLTDALRILDALVHQVSNGCVQGLADDLPWVTHQVTVEPGADTAPVPMPAAAFGVLGGRPAGAIIRTDGGVTVIGVPDGTPLAELPPTGAPPRAVAFGEVDGAGVVVTGGDDGVLRVWAADGTPVSAQTRHCAPVSAITSTIDDGTLVVWSADLAGRLLEGGLRPGGRVRAWPAHPAGVSALGWAGTDTYQMLVTGADDGRVRIHPVSRPDEAEIWESHRGWVNALAVIGADDDFLVASAGADRVIRVRTGLAGTEWPALTGHTESVTGLAFGLIGDRLVLGSCALDGTARTWDVHTREVLAEWPVGDDWPATIVDVSTGGVQRWATGGADGLVRIWDAETGAAVWTLTPDGHRSAVLAVASALLPGGTLVAAGYQDGSFCLWDAGDGTLVGVDRSAPEPLTSVEFGRDAQVDAFLCGTAAGSVRVYDPATAAFWHVVTPHTDQVLAIATGTVEQGAPTGGQVLVSGSADHTVRVWDARTGWPLHCLSGHRDLVTTVAVGRVNGRTVIASAGYDRTVRIWDAIAGVPLLLLDGATFAVYQLAFGAVAGRPVVAAAGYGDGIRVWDAGSGRPLLATRPVDGLPRALVVDTWHGREVALAASADGTVRCWSLPDGDLLSTAQLTHEPLALWLSPTGALWALGVHGVTAVDMEVTG